MQLNSYRSPLIQRNISSAPSALPRGTLDLATPSHQQNYADHKLACALRCVCLSHFMNYPLPFCHPRGSVTLGSRAPHVTYQLLILQTSNYAAVMSIYYDFRRPTSHAVGVIPAFYYRPRATARACLGRNEILKNYRGSNTAGDKIDK